MPNNDNGDARFYRPGLKDWWPGAPPMSGGSRVWNGDGVLDWSSGRVANRRLATESKISAPGLRKRSLKSGKGLVYHEGGPYHGAKLRRTTKDKYKRVIEILPTSYVVPGYHGRYEYSEEKDQYLWKPT